MIGKWQYVPVQAEWAAPKDKQARKQGLPEVQLYNVKDDIGETNNLQAKNPEKVEELTKLLKSYV